MLLGEQVICNPCYPLVVGCLVYCVLIGLVGNYHGGHLMELLIKVTNVLMRSLRWYLLHVFKSYCL